MSAYPVDLPGDRLDSIDAHRGFVMVALISSGLGFRHVAKHFPNSSAWKVLSYEFSHVEWTGCSFWDLVQPSFMFLVGVALPFSVARRRAAGDGFGKLILHALLRSIVLVMLGVILFSNGVPRTNFVFTNVLAQIGLGYMFAFLVTGRGLLVQLAVALLALGGAWYLFFQEPIHDAAFATELGIPATWNRFTGFAAHWNEHVNFAGQFDRWFLNLFPRPGDKPFVVDNGGYQTLNFVPSIATMIFGVMAGELLLSAKSPMTKRNLLLLAGALCFAVSMSLDHTIWPTGIPGLAPPPTAPTNAGFDEIPFTSTAWTVCPIVKRIWTPTFAVFSAGWVFWMLAAFYSVIDVGDFRSWAFPFIVVGRNSIAIYVLHELCRGWITQTLKTHLGPSIFNGTYGPILERLSVLLVLWLICYWLYRQRAFLRI